MEIKYSVIINLLTCTIREERHRQYGTALQKNWWTNQRKGTRAADKPPSKIVKLSSSTMFVWQNWINPLTEAVLANWELVAGNALRKTNIWKECSLPAAVFRKNREVKHDVYGNGKRQKWNFCRLSWALCTVESQSFYSLWIVRDTFL